MHFKVVEKLGGIFPFIETKKSRKEYLTKRIGELVPFAKLREDHIAHGALDILFTKMAKNARAKIRAAKTTEDKEKAFFVIDTIDSILTEIDKSCEELDRLSSELSFINSAEKGDKK